MLTTGKEGGFTFLEVLIALLIIGIATALILPSFNSYFRSAETKTIQRKVINLFKQLRTEAVVSNSTLEVVVKKDSLLFLDKQQIGLEIAEGLAEIKFMQQKQGSLQKDKKVIEEDKIIFYPDGTSSGGSLIITLKAGNSFRIDIDRVSGEVYWREYSGK